VVSYPCNVMALLPKLVKYLYYLWNFHKLLQVSLLRIQKRKHVTATNTLLTAPVHLKLKRRAYGLQVPPWTADWVCVFSSCLLAGLIRLRSSPPPHLQGVEYVLNVTAADDNASGGSHALSSTALVIVGVDDVNNNKPVFKKVRKTMAYLHH